MEGLQVLPKLLAPISSLRYENLVTGDTCTSAESISALNWFQNRGQSVCVLLNFVITSFGSFVLIDCLVLVHCSLLFRFFRFSSICISYLSFCSNFAFSNCISSWYFCSLISAAWSSSLFFAAWSDTLFNSLILASRSLTAILNTPMSPSNFVFQRRISSSLFPPPNRNSCTFTLRSWTSSTFIAKVLHSLSIDVRFPFSVALLACEHVNLSRSSCWGFWCSFPYSWFLRVLAGSPLLSWTGFWQIITLDMVVHRFAFSGIMVTDFLVVFYCISISPLT